MTARKERLLSQLAKRGGSGSSQRVPPATAPPHEERLAANTDLGQSNQCQVPQPTRASSSSRKSSVKERAINK